MAVSTSQLEMLILVPRLTEPRLGITLHTDTKRSKQTYIYIYTEPYHPHKHKHTNKTLRRAIRKDIITFHTMTCERELVQFRTAAARPARLIP